MDFLIKTDLSQRQLPTTTLMYCHARRWIPRETHPTIAPFKVNSPGPAAGAYWLERRQSYRVKMVAPPAASSSNNDGRGSPKHLHHYHQQQQQQQRPRRPPNNNATSSASMQFDADDRALRKKRTPVKGTGTTTPNNAVRPMTTTPTSTSTPAKLRSRGRGRGGDKRTW